VLVTLVGMSADALQRELSSGLVATSAAVPRSESLRNHAAFIWSVADLLRGDYKRRCGEFLKTSRAGGTSSVSSASS
jgi:hypothetical protein